MDVAFLTIAELNRAYTQRELSPVEVTRALLDRIAKHDGKLDSFIRVTEDAALAEAKTAETEMVAGNRGGPMHGIPFGLKDIVETAGIPTTGHSKLRQHHVPKADAEIVRRLKAGGGILMGKLATWEFANGGPAVTVHPTFADAVWRASACAPQLRHGDGLAALRYRLAVRAARAVRGGGEAGGRVARENSSLCLPA